MIYRLQKLLDSKRKTKTTRDVRNGLYERKNSLPWDNCVFSDLVSCVKAEPTALLWDRVPLFDVSVPKDVKELPALRDFFLMTKKNLI